MGKIIDAVYEKGKIKPLQKVELREGEKLRIEVSRMVDEAWKDFIGLTVSQTFQALANQKQEKSDAFSTKLPSELERKIERLVKFEKADKASILRKALETGIEEELKKIALNLYLERKVSLAKAAEIAEISIRDMLKLIRDRGVSLNLTVEDLRKDFEEATG